MLTIIMMLYYYQKGSLSIGPLLVLATLIRPEGFLLFLFIEGFELMSRRKVTALLICTLAVYLLALMPYAVFKLIYYGGVIPNTFYAKAGFGFERLIDGFTYFGRFAWHYLGAGVFLLPVIYFVIKGPRAIKLTAFLSLVYIVYIILIGGDVLKVHRFFIPIYPLLAILIIFSINRLFKNKAVLVSVMAIIVGWQLFVPYEFVNEYHRTEKSFTYKMTTLAKKLDLVDDTDFSVAISTIGAFGYNLIGHDIIDLLGLTDSTIARHPDQPPEGLETTWKERRFNSSYILNRNPDYVLFSTGIKPSAPAEKSLMTYSKFLQNYRLIGFFFEGRLNNIYKRFYSNSLAPIRDVDINFVNLFADGIYNYSTKNYKESYAYLQEASRYVADTIFPYVKYTKSLILKHSGKYEECRRILEEIIANDTLVYHAYADLCHYEWLVSQDTAKVLYYRNEVKRIVPWYLPRLDNLLKRTGQARNAGRVP